MYVLQIPFVYSSHGQTRILSVQRQNSAKGTTAIPPSDLRTDPALAHFFEESIIEERKTERAAGISGCGNSAGKRFRSPIRGNVCLNKDFGVLICKGGYMNFQELFHLQIEKFLEPYRGRKTAVFFKGFGRLQSREILAAGGMEDGSVLNADGTVNIPALDAQKSEMEKRFLSAAGLVTGLYEQYLALTYADPGFREAFGGEIVITENNLFSCCYPACIPLDAARKLYGFFRQDAIATPEGLEPFLCYYGETISPDDSHYFVEPVDRHTDENLKRVPFFPEADIPCGSNMPQGTGEVPITGSDFLIRKADLLDGREPGPAVYITDSDSRGEKYGFPAFSAALKTLGIPFGISSRNRFNETENSSPDEFLPLLRKYWGEKASFRTLKFYRDPDKTSETVLLSQGDIISQIVRQSRAALSGNRSFSDIFATAPTGAGKSLLFQLPAIYLAEKYNAVTIVITPLIALMKDQVAQLEEEHHVSCATFINSTISFGERENRMKQIRSGEKSIVYLAPELLVSTPLKSIIGDRPVGLFVIDEAHIVISWGKDFRADYWYLGDLLKRLKRDGFWFPVLCLTATAVYGGAEDVVNETVESLSLNNPIIFLGDVRRNNIRFDIRRPAPDEEGGVEKFKLKCATEAIQSFVERKEKALVYCPFVSQVDNIYNRLDPSVRPQVKKYYGTMDKQARNAAQNSFESDECSVMVCTKAFGMGIDIRNIRHIYHYAPTGSLADYVQEIGRAAREEGSQGCASADFLGSDIHYVRTLYGISEMKQYQLNEMIRKLYGIYRERGSRNFLVSPEAFSYMFKERELDNKVKNGLLLISKDLEAVYGVPVITIRPKTMFTKNYVNVPLPVEDEFSRRYGDFAHKLDDHTKRILPSRNKRYESDTTVINSGHVYELDMAGIWKNFFQNMSSAQFRSQFFSGELFRFASGERLTPRIHIRARYSMEYQKMLDQLKESATILANIFRAYKTKGETFTADDFKADLKREYGGKFTKLDFAGMLLNMFIADLSQNTGFRANRDRLKFISARKAPSGEFVYRIMNTGYLTMPNYFVQLAMQCAPSSGNTFQAYIPFGRNGKCPERVKLLAMLELFGLATYQVEGGQDMEIFVRVNDPGKLEKLTEEKYTNRLLTNIRKRHQTSQEIMKRFMEKDLTTEQRWDVIENYFLGRENTVAKMLKN